jgi:hypothetical protein
MMIEAGMRDCVMEDRWFDRIASTPNDPWLDWRRMLSKPPQGYHPLEAWIEYDIENAIEAADQLRLTVTPTTEHFAAIWARFRRQHEELDDCGDYRRNRYLVWRAAALKVMCDRNRFQDDINRKQARDKLVVTMLEFGPYGADGSVIGYQCNFWHPRLSTFSDGSVRPSPLEDYASMVLLLMRQSARSSTRGSGALR